jgi:signal transduction histidine kinase
MTRRIALVVIVLVTVLLGVVAIPLGLHIASQDTSDFTAQASATAATVASVAEEHLDDHVPITSLRQAIAELSRQGDLVSVYARNGKLVAGDPVFAGAAPRQLRLALTGTASATRPSEDRLIAASPVLKDESQVSIGAVVLVRSTEPLDHRIDALWAFLALVSALGLVAAAATAAGLARWVGRPLAGLESAARNLGAGELGARAPATAGPPEVRRLADNFNVMAARLETLLSGHQAMIADVSHQLRTPLAALRLRLDVLALAAPDPMTDELAGAQDEIARLSRLVDGLLAVARAENVTSPAVRVPVSAVLAERMAAWLPAAEEKLIVLSGREPDEPADARLGEGHLEQVLDNLLANALEAVPEGGRIDVSAGAVDGLIKVVVADNGPGMTPRQRQTALRRYVSATPGGTGLGLAIVHRLVTTDGGSIKLAETPGGGLTVVLDLPAFSRDRAFWRPGNSAIARNLKQF